MGRTITRKKLLISLIFYKKNSWIFSFSHQYHCNRSHLKNYLTFRKSLSEISPRDHYEIMKIKILTMMKYYLDININPDGFFWIHFLMSTPQVQSDHTKNSITAEKRNWKRNHISYWEKLNSHREQKRDPIWGWILLLFPLFTIQFTSAINHTKSLNEILLCLVQAVPVFIYY